MRSMIVAAFALAIALGAPLASSADTAASLNAQEGCMNQWLFNGVWRVQVTKVEPFMDGARQVGWQVTEQWRNGSNQEIAPGDTVLKDQKLELKDGSSLLASETTTTSMSMGVLAAHTFQTAAQFSYVQIFRSATIDPTNKPVALDVLFDGAKLAQFHSKPQFTTHQYNFRFKLDCVASGAAAQAQGGSTQVAAVPGCLNQWVSNGVWRVRATAIGPDMGNDGVAQIGWMVTEDWASLANRKITAGNFNITDQQLTLGGGNTIASSNTAVTNMNMTELGVHEFPPGGSFTYKQRFRQAPFDPTDKPIRLLFTFNAKAQSLYPQGPYYKTPADFRIDLTCSK